VPKSVSVYKILDLLIMNNKHRRIYLQVHLYVGIYTDIHTSTHKIMQRAMLIPYSNVPLDAYNLL